MNTAYSFIFSIFSFFILSTPCLSQREKSDAEPVHTNHAQNFDSKIKHISLSQIDLLMPANLNNSAHLAYVRKAQYYTISSKNLQQLRDDKPAFFTQELIIQNKKVKLMLEKVEILSPGFHIKTSDERIIFPEVNNIIHYRGYVHGQQNSWATLMISDLDVQYLIASEEGNYEINKTEGGYYAGYLSRDQLNTPEYSMHAEDTDHVIVRPSGVNGGIRTGNCLEVYLETDFYTYQQLGSVINVDRWAKALFANVAAVYALHNVSIVISQLYIWTTNDPYSSQTNPLAVKNQFVSTIQNTYSGRVAQLLTLRPLGGGLSNGIGGFCSSYPTYPGPQCISTSLSSSNDAFPNYSFNTYVVAHEMGHVMGLRHTHACVWNNTYVQIDDCGNINAFNNNQTIEGSSCFHSSSPVIPSGGGTIMSNCNLISGVGINLSGGFGPLPGQALYNNFVYSACTTGGTCTSIAPPHDLCQNAINLPVNNTCKNYTFTNVNATATAGPPGFTCGSPGTVIKDVWFKLSIPSSGNVTIATSQSIGGLTDVLAQAYTGSCGTLTTIVCDDNSGSGNHVLLNITGRTAGEDIYIRLVDTDSNDEGTFNICAYDGSVACHPDLSTLVNFYNATGGASWTNKTGWQNGAAGTNCDVCSWFGVTCNELGRVSGISLSSNNLNSSNIPASLANLTYLSTLRLYNNHLSGSLPAFLNNFAYLTTLDLGKNNFTGTIPTNLGSIMLLKNLYLENNLLTGNLPPTLVNINLSLIYVNNNNLSGCIPAGYSVFCGKAYNFSANPNLAGGIPFSTYCKNGDGGDEDSDGFCQGLGDCNDMDNTMFPGNPEVCDFKDNDCNGLIDDLAAPLTNIWIAGSGNWHTAANWSLGTVPQRCQNVVISGINGITITIQSGQIAVARSVTVQSGKSLIVQNSASLTINYGLNVINSGTITNNGSITINNILDNALFGIQNTGTITNASTGNITLVNSGVRSLSNNTGGVFTNNGSLIIDSNVTNGMSTGLYNLGAVNNTGNVTVRNINGKQIIIAPGAVFTNQSTGILNLEK